MSNTITIELCSEDRARLDRLAEALERKTCDKCVANVTDYLKSATMPTILTPMPEPDDIQQKLEKIVAKADDTVEAPKNAPEQAETSTQTSTPPEVEKPTAEEPTPAPTAKTIDRAELRAKVIELSAKGLKEQTKDIVRAYAQTVTAVPEDKLTECYKKLVALEG